jgi:dolichol-phosphate mannosyltransferase
MAAVNTPEKLSCLIVVPTYRERDNILNLHSALAQQGICYRLLAIDDGSDDGTHEVLTRLQAQGAPVIVFQRHKKLGLGTAYVLAFAYARLTRHQCIVQMDADLSHAPEDLPRLITTCRDYDMVIGSRYVAGGYCEGWPWHRQLLSAAANWLVRSTLRLDMADATGGFKCLRRSLLQRLAIERITAAGFAFQWDFNRLAAELGASVAEVPICFRQRTTGRSKMSIRIMLEGLGRLFRIKCQTWKKQDGRGGQWARKPHKQ